MKNVSQIKNCFGCGVCSASCPKKIISISLNKDGFYAPYIEEEQKCIDCGICLNVCAFNHSKCLAGQDKIETKGWGAWSKDNFIRQSSSSGGIGFEIAKYLIDRDYQVAVCKYNTETQRAEHYIAKNITELMSSIGSKYIQSYTEEAFLEIKRSGHQYLVVGTPCQIDSFRRMARRYKCEENFVLMDFFCHCVPSMLTWKAYLKYIEPKVGTPILASWRNKLTGWHDSYTMKIIGNKGEMLSWRTKGDLFYKLFLGDLTLGPQCQKQCKYKLENSAADIRIGDFWGATYKDDNKGVSAVLAFTKKGEEIVRALDNVHLIEHQVKTVMEGQLQSNAKAKITTPIIMFILRNGGGLNSFPFKITYNIQRLINVMNIKIKRLMK